MHLYQLNFEEREAYDEQLALHAAVAPARAEGGSSGEGVVEVVGKSKENHGKTIGKA